MVRMQSNRISRKQLDFLIEIIKKPVFNDGSAVYSKMQITRVARSLRYIGFDIKIFRWVGRTAGHQSYKSQKGFIRFTLIYMPHNKRKAYKMAMERIGPYYTHWMQIAKPILGDLVVTGGQGTMRIKDEEVL